MRAEIDRLQRELGSDDDLRDPRSGRGDDDGRPGRGDAEGRAAAVAAAAGRSTTGRPTCSWPGSSAQPGDEHARGRRFSRRRRPRSVGPQSAVGPRARGRGRGRTACPARARGANCDRRDPARAHRGRRLAPGTRRRRRLQGQVSFAKPSAPNSSSTSASTRSVWPPRRRASSPTAGEWGAGRRSSDADPPLTSSGDVSGLTTGSPRANQIEVRRWTPPQCISSTRRRASESMTRQKELVQRSGRSSTKRIVLAALAAVPLALLAAGLRREQKSTAPTTSASAGGRPNSSVSGSISSTGSGRRRSRSRSAR